MSDLTWLVQRGVRLAVREGLLGTVLRKFDGVIPSDTTVVSFQNSELLVKPKVQNNTNYSTLVYSWRQKAKKIYGPPETSFSSLFFFPLHVIVRHFYAVGATPLSDSTRGRTCMYTRIFFVVLSCIFMSYSQVRE